MTSVDSRQTKVKYVRVKLSFNFHKILHQRGALKKIQVVLHNFRAYYSDVLRAAKLKLMHTFEGLRKGAACDSDKRVWIFELNSKTKPPLPCVFLKQHTDWLEQCRAPSKPLCFPFTEPRLEKHQSVRMDS